MKSKVSIEEIKHIRHEYLEGASCRELSKMTRYSYGTIYRILSANHPLTLDMSNILRSHGGRR